MECKYKNKLNDVNFCKVEYYYCTYYTKGECMKRHPEYFVGCKYCEDMDEMYQTVCYIPHDNGIATDIPVNFCPYCGRKLE